MSFRRRTTPVASTPAPEPDLEPTAPAAPTADPRAIEQFLFREARLLDDREWDEWLALWADNATYAMPTRETPQSSETDPARPVANELISRDEVWWFDETKEIMELRIAKFRTGKAWAEDPPSRTRRFVTNIEVDRIEAGSDDQDPFLWRVRSNVLLYRSRLQHDTELLSAARDDRIAERDGSLIILGRMVILDVAVPPVANLCLFF